MKVCNSNSIVRKNKINISASFLNDPLNQGGILLLQFIFSFFFFWEYAALNNGNDMSIKKKIDIDFTINVAQIFFYINLSKWRGNLPSSDNAEKLTLTCSFNMTKF